MHLRILIVLASLLVGGCEPVLAQLAPLTQQQARVVSLYIGGTTNVLSHNGTNLTLNGIPVSGFPAQANMDADGYAMFDLGYIAFNGSTNRLLYDGTNLTFGGSLLGSGTGGAGSQTPWTTNINGAWMRLTNVSLVVASNLTLLGNVSLANPLTVPGLTVNGNATVNGNLTVNGTTYSVMTIYNTTNVNIGTTTSYVATVIYSTNIQYEVTMVYTQRVTTNSVDTYVNIGGSFTMGAGSTFNATGATSVIFPFFSATQTGGVDAAGTWDFTGATVIGLGAGTVSNVVSSNAWLTANIVGGTLYLSSTATPLFAEQDLLGIAAAQAANATSINNRAAATNTPTDGAAIVWSAALNRYVHSDAPPASSTGSVSAVNSGVGLVTIQGGAGISVGTAGTTNPIVTVSQSSLLIHSNTAGLVGYTNNAGQFQTFRSDPFYTNTTFSYVDEFSSGDFTTRSNYNLGAWSNAAVLRITNGMLTAVALPENGNPRFVSTYVLQTSGTWFRSSMIVRQSPIGSFRSQGPTVFYGFGLRYHSMSGVVVGAHVGQTQAGPQWYARTFTTNWAFSGIMSTEAVAQPFDPYSSMTLVSSSVGPDEHMLYIDGNGTNQIYFYTSSLHGSPQLVAAITNAAYIRPLESIAIAVASTQGSTPVVTTSRFFSVDRFTVEEGLRW